MNARAALVDGKYGIADLVDLDELRRIFARFTEATGFTIGFLDHPGLNVLIATGWRDLCAKYHRQCPAAAANCLESNRHLLNNLDEPGKLVIEECSNGLVDCAFPIVIKGKHIASLATGQLLLAPPDRERFRRQARAFGCDEEAYLACLDEIPVVSEEKLRSVTRFLGEMASLLTEIGYSRLRLKAESEALQNAQKIQSLSVLAGGIAHDFNNYLGGILGHVDLALECAADKPGQAAFHLGQVSSIVDRARHLTHRLLTFTKGGAPILKTGSIVELVRETATFSTTGSSAALDFHAAPGVPACSFDPVQLAQVVQNLVINAIEAMPRGGTVHVAVLPATADMLPPGLPPGDYVRASVRDEGPGIPPDVLPRIFEPFFTTKATGNGLGLSICYSIVNRHNGHIEAVSPSGQGAEFVFFLPALRDTGPLVAAGGDEPVHQGQGLALVMDDDPSIGSVVSAMLRKMGYDTITASDGTEALQELETQPCRLAMLDLTVPGGMGGIEAAREIRRRHGDSLMLIAMSGYTDARALADPKAFGFNGSIGKPFRKSELSALLNASRSR